MSELKLHFAKMRQRHLSIISKSVDDLERHKIAERIDAAKRGSAVFVGEARNEEFRAIPIA
jgi:hypothetical protein